MERTLSCNKSSLTLSKNLSFCLVSHISFFHSSILDQLKNELCFDDVVDDMIAKEEEKEMTGPVHVAPETLRELKDKLEAQYASKKQEQIKQLEDLRTELAKKENELERQKKYYFFCSFKHSCCC